MASSFIPDRGHSPYFHGRKEIIETNQSGTTFLIQGAPEPKKITLLDVDALSEKRDRKSHWEVTRISPVDIDTPASMAHPSEIRTRLIQIEQRKTV